MDDSFLPSDILGNVIPQLLNFTACRNIGSTCKTMSRCWRSWPRKIPEKYIKQCSAPTLATFTNLTELQCVPMSGTIKELSSLKHLVNVHNIYTGSDVSFSTYVEKLETSHPVDSSFANLRNLRELKLFCKGNEKYLEDLKILPNLRSLTSSSSALIIPTIEKLTQLTELDINIFHPNNRLINLSALVNLTSLRISDTNVDLKTNLPYLVNLTHLTTTIHDETNFNDYTKLQSLTIQYYRIGMIDQLVNLTSLRVDHGLRDKNLVGLSNLTSLTFHSTNVSDFGLFHLCNLENLELLSTCALITGSCFRFMPKLRRLIAKSDKINVNYIKQITSLTELYVHHVIGSAGISDLINLRTLSIGHKADNNGMHKLVNLTSLDIRNNTKLSNSGISHLTNLTELDIRSNHKINDLGLINLTNLIKLNTSRPFHDIQTKIKQRILDFGDI